jgi:hypothetical protein
MENMVIDGASAGGAAERQKAGEEIIGKRNAVTGGIKLIESPTCGGIAFSRPGRPCKIGPGSTSSRFIEEMK